MFADPQSVTYATVAKSLAASGNDLNSRVYTLNDAGVVYTLTISHQNAKRNRCVARLQRSSFATDPLVPAQNILASMTATFTIDTPTTGLTAADGQNLGNALVAWLSSANILKMINGET